jgi:hypothetical protein
MSETTQDKNCDVINFENDIPEIKVEEVKDDITEKVPGLITGDAIDKTEVKSTRRRKSSSKFI